MIHRFLHGLSLAAFVVAAAAASAQEPQQQAPLTFDQVPAATPTYGQPAYGQPAQSPAQPQPPANPAVDPATLAGQPATAAAPAPPFVLTDMEAQFVYQTLQMWETQSAKVNTFKADFQRLEYDRVFGPGAERPMIVSRGVVSYAKPDRGSFKIEKISRWTKTDPQNADPAAPGEYVEQKEEIGEHWVCDGKAFYEYDHRSKQLRETRIPEELRGTQIVEGPLPFLFGAEAKKLAERYWIRAKQGNPAEIWLEAFPRRQSDAANYDFVEVMLDRKTMQPLAIQVHLPGGQQRHVYTFESPSVNGTMDALFGSLFSAPRTPIGWKRVVATESELPPGAPQAANPGEALQR
jgi:TIGR03009 family protein